jgi:hypothetical protein
VRQLNCPTQAKTRDKDVALSDGAAIGISFPVDIPPERRIIAAASPVLRPGSRLVRKRR